MFPAEIGRFKTDGEEPTLKAPKLKIGNIYLSIGNT